jgi:hypothetical protein
MIAALMSAQAVFAQDVKERWLLKDDGEKLKAELRATWSE